MPARKPLKDRISRYSVDENGCWNWSVGKDRDGYGQIKEQGKTCFAHRVSYEFHCGPIPSGMQVLHKCDNPSCINPDHLFLGNNTENMLDRDSKGRQQRGHIHYKAKLSEQDVCYIRASGEDKHALAQRFGVSSSTVHLILTRKTWNHVQ